MQNLLKNDTNEFIYKTEIRLTNLENELWVTRREGVGGGIDWEFGVDTYTLLCLKQIISNDLLIQHRELCSIFCNNINGKRI